MFPQIIFYKRSVYSYYLPVKKISSSTPHHVSKNRHMFYYSHYEFIYEILFD